MKTTFNLTATVQVQGEGRMEDAYTYVSEDGTKSLQFRAHSKRAFVFVPMANTNVDKKLFSKLINAFVSAGCDQHDYAGGFDEAIKTLKV